MPELLRWQGCIFYFCVKCIAGCFIFFEGSGLETQGVGDGACVVWWSIFSGPKVEFNIFFMLEIQGWTFGPCI